MSSASESSDEDADALATTSAARARAAETLDFLGVRATREHDDVGAFEELYGAVKRARGAGEAAEALGGLTLAFDGGWGDGGRGLGGRRRGGRPPPRAKERRRAATLDLGVEDEMRALDEANAVAETLASDRGAELALEVRRPRDGAAWLLGLALRGGFGGASNLERLTSLTLRGGKGLSVDGFTTLIGALKGDARSLRNLDVSSCGLGVDAAKALVEVLDENGCPLERLDLKANSLGADGALALSCALSREKSSLKALNVAQNLIGAEGVRALVAAIAGASNLRDLDLQHNGCGDHGAHAFAQHGLGSLENLSLGFNGIGADGARAIAEALRKRHRSDDDDMDVHGGGDDDAVGRASKMLKRLDLKCNTVGSDGAHALAESLNDVEDLDLSNNSLRDGTKWIAKSLKSKALNLKQLSLQANEMTDDDAWWIADALGENNSLKTLNLGSNALGDSGASDLASDLRENTSLETLDLTRNTIGKDGANELMDAMDENKTLTRLAIESNLIPAETTLEMKRRVGLRAQCDWQRAGFSDTAAAPPTKFT